MKCRHCAEQLEQPFINLGYAPPSNAYLSATDLNRPERYFPLRLFVCEHCWLVQTEDYARADELFDSSYAYFSSVSNSWLQHAKDYAAMITKRLGLDANTHVIEVAANDGYLLKNFVAAGIPCLGIEPTASTAAAAEQLGIPIRREFFGEPLAKRLASEEKQADLIIGNNVFAHVPDINDFTRGLKTALKPGGTITLEFPHLMRLIEHTQFDTVYHEHFSYLSLYTVGRIFAHAGLRVFDVEQLSTHGGSLRVFGCHHSDSRPETTAVTSLLSEEESRGMRSVGLYKQFQSRADRIKDDLLTFLIEHKKAGQHVAAYGAAAKGCTLLNYAGVKPDLLPYVCDAALSKQGKYLPGSHVPILHPDAIRQRRPDVILLLPWNLKDELMQQLDYVRDWGGRFAVVVPTIEVL